MNKNQILLSFTDEETAEYVKLVARRKGFNLADYIVDNFEWDELPECIQEQAKRVTVKMCVRCDFSDRCPDEVHIDGLRL